MLVHQGTVVSDATDIEPGPSSRLGAWWAVVIVAAGTLIRVPQLGRSLAGDHAFRQTQTAFGIQGFAEHGVNLLHSPLPVFGSATDVPIEFPLFQALGRLLMYPGLDADTAGRTAGLLGFQGAAMLWWVLLRRWHGTALATTTLVLFEILPFGLHWGAASLIDYFSVALGFTMVLGFDVWVRSGTAMRWAGLAACALGAWSVFLVKVTTVPGTCLLLVLSVFFAATQVGWREARVRTAIGLLVGPGVGLGLLTAWTRHADSIKDRHAATEFLMSTRLWGWNFGHTRLDAHSWETILRWADGSILGAFGLTAVIGAALGLGRGDRRTRILTLALLTSAVAPVLIFFHLFVVHTYYQIAVYPFLVTLGAIGIVSLSDVARRSSPVLLLLPVILVLTWLLTTSLSTFGRNDIHQFVREWWMPPAVAELEAATPPGAKVLFVGCGWDPEDLFFAERTGLMLRPASPTQVSRIWRQNRIEDYSYLYVCGRSASAATLLPAGTTLSPTSQPHVYQVAPRPVVR